MLRIIFIIIFLGSAIALEYLEDNGLTSKISFVLGMIFLFSFLFI